MNEEAGFLRAIVAEREDDTHRLVFADWLDDHGDSARAEFIRTQVQLARIAPGDADYDELKLTEQRLLKRHAVGWLQPLRPCLSSAFSYGEDFDKLAVFRRGFLDTAFVDVDHFLAYPDDLFDAAPVSGLIFWVRELAPELLDCATLRRATRLHFMSAHDRICRGYARSILLAPASLMRLAQGRHFQSIRELDLSSQSIPVDALTALVRSPRWAGLETLKLARAGLDGAGFAALASARALPRLRRLDVHGNPYGTLQGWRRAPWLKQLEALNLGGCRLRVEDVVSFLEKARCPALQNLSLGALLGGDTGGRLAKALQGLPRLRSLDLTWWHFTEPLRSLTQGGPFASLHRLIVASGFNHDTAGLFPSQAFPNLRDLNLSSSNLAGQVAALADSSLARTLRRLDLHGCSLSEAEVVAFSRKACFPELETLTLGEHAGYQAKTLAALTFEGFPRLRTLRIPPSGKVNALEALAAAPVLSRLKYLHLHGGRLAEKQAEKLLALPGFQGLTGLGLYGTSYKDETGKRLRDHFGDRFLS
jgi:uncharacterized protein (TIGR02996 family)